MLHLGNAEVRETNCGAAVVRQAGNPQVSGMYPVSYTHLRAHETVLDLVCRLLLEKTHILD